MGSTGQDSVRKGTFWGHSIYFFVADRGFPTDLLDIICTLQSDSLSFELKASLLVIKQKVELQVSYVQPRRQDGSRFPV